MQAGLHHRAGLAGSVDAVVGIALGLQADLRVVAVHLEHDGEAPGRDVAQRLHLGQGRAPVAGGLDVAHRAAEAVGLVVAHEAVGQRLARDILHLRVERGADRETALVELLLAVLVAELATNLLGEEAAVVGVGREHARGDAERLGLGRVAVLDRDVAVADHLVDDVVAPVDRLVAMREGLVVVRPLRQRGEIGDLGHGQLVHRLAEIVQGRGGDAVVAEAEIDLVEVELEDLLLRIGRLDLEGEQRLLDLAVERSLVGQQEVLGDLLGDRRGALDVLAALDQHHRGAGDAFEVDAVVRVEVLVLGRDEGFLHQGGDRRGRQVQAALVGIFGEHRAVAGVDAGHHRRLVVLELGVVRQILLVLVRERRPRRSPTPRTRSRRSRRSGRETGR